ncbi:GLPGLI family protein [Polaribacter sp. HaHaR_3_91]|uniref:GLPGLI family protein n=1 Tax=Polaribacter sp. HaHaR_3_91 TaxID=2745561 RepID=UPI001C4ED070|nr:GLPGLI family protein [Polaribacter sp. HaHaR_3_91]QXP63718.1 GLPGLI family protein [Polaribacter sp. HaHaR_3_91]
MRILKITIILFFITYNINSQNSFRAYYNVEVIDSTKFKVPEKYLGTKHEVLLIKRKKETLKTISLSKKIDFILDFDNMKSIFYLPKQLDIKKGYISIIKRIGRFKGTYFTNQEGVLWEKNSFGQDFLVTLPANKWNITNLSKKCGKYLCYKATLINEIETSRGLKKRHITAWFSSEIPFSFGPKEFSGLPGLIMQLQEGNMQYQLKEIVKVDNSKIGQTKIGRKINLYEFNLLSKKMYKSLKLKNPD